MRACGSCKRKWLSVVHTSLITWLYSTMHEQIISIQTKVSSPTTDLSTTRPRWPSLGKRSFTGVLISFSHFLCRTQNSIKCMKRFPLLLFSLSLYESPTRANFVPLDINFAVTVTVYVCRYHFFHYLLHSPVMTDLHSPRLFIEQ
jgi:hypothetical protein